MESVLGSIGEELKTITGSHKNFESMMEEVEMLEGAQASATLAFTLHSLYYSLMKLQGEDDKDHPLITKEIPLVRKTFQKLKTAMAKAEEAKTTEPTTKPE